MDGKTVMRIDPTIISRSGRPNFDRFDMKDGSAAGHAVFVGSEKTRHSRYEVRFEVEGPYAIPAKNTDVIEGPEES